jgi:hypothetical protein
VIQRARNRCEYCGLSQVSQEAQFHIDHIVPSALGGQTVFENLALACVSCSLRKGARGSVIDPLSGVEVAIFNPRREAWLVHFRWDGAIMVGLSEIGRALVEALLLNRRSIVAIRIGEMAMGRHPPPWH